MQKRKFQTIDRLILQEVINNSKNLNTSKSENVWGRLFEQYLIEVESPMLNQLTGDQIQDHLESFYFQLKKKNGEDYTGSSLRTSLGALSRFIHLKTGYNFGISPKSNLFKLVDAKIKALAVENKDEIKHSKPLTHEQEVFIILLNSFKMS
jgi:hypothetical protein